MLEAMCKAFHQAPLCNKPWLVKSWLNFDLNFGFQFLYKFTGQLKKVETCDGNGQQLWQVLPSFQPSHLGYYFVFSWLIFKHTEYKGTLI